MHSPKLVVLDSAHWIGLIKAATSASSALRDKARAFPKQILREGYVLTLAFHHLEELVSHENDQEVRRRLDFLGSLRSIAWLRSLSPPHGLGAITDILAAEAIAQCEGATDLSAVHDNARTKLISFGDAPEAIGDLEVWWMLRHAFRLSGGRTRALAAIAPVNFGNGSEPLSTLAEGRFRTPEETRDMLALMGASLTREIATRGDLRIHDPAGTAREFFAEVEQACPTGEASVWDFIVRTSEERGVSREEIRPDMTGDELGDLCVFRSQLEIIAEKTGRTFDTLRRTVKMELCPHWVLQSSLSRHSQAGLRRPGSDINDGYLACLALYVDRLYVDRRRSENFRRAAPNTPELAPLLGSVAKAAHYWEIPSQLSCETVTTGLGRRKRRRIPS